MRYTVSLEYAYSEAQLTQLVAAAPTARASGLDRPRMFRAGFAVRALPAALCDPMVSGEGSRTDARFLTQR